MNLEAEKLSNRIKDILDAKSAVDIDIIDISTRTVVADYFVICTGKTPLQVRALADSVQEALESESISPSHIEGYTAGRWILLDYSSVVVHIFHKDDREFYSLERLWSGAHPSRDNG